MSDVTKKFKIKVYFSDKTEKCEGIAVKDAYGNNAGMAIVIGDEAVNLPVTSKQGLHICDAELTVFLPQKKEKGVITLLKKMKTKRK